MKELESAIKTFVGAHAEKRKTVFLLGYNLDEGLFCDLSTGSRIEDRSSDR